MMKQIRNMSYNPYSLEGKTILVTGASSGIGQRTAIECSKLGAKLVITGRNIERLNDTFCRLEGDGHSQLLTDLTTPNSIDLLTRQLPVLNGVVLCAGQGMMKPFRFSSRDQFDKVFNVNFFSSVELLRLLVKKKLLDKQSSVVFVSSIGGIRNYDPGTCIYGSSKAALDSIMKYCAIELAPQKIRVNSVNPGMVHTQLITPKTLSEEQFLTDVKKYPLKRYGETIDVALGIIYLLSNASSWVTGNALFIDGGRSIC